MANWHALSVTQVLEQHSVDIGTGLTSREIEKRLAQFGLNELPEQKPDSYFVIFIRQFRSPLIYLLLVAAAVAAALHETSDALVILVVLFVNAVIGSIQEGRAARSIDALRKLSTLKCTVRRDGKDVTLEVRYIVPGDILLLAAGDQVPADARVLQAHSLEVAEAALTGESLPVAKSASELPVETPLFERTNLVFSGTYVTAGRSVVLAVDTGQKTEVGKIAELTTSSPTVQTPLERRIHEFGKYIIYAAGALFLFVLAVGALRDLPFKEVLMVGISQIVSMIPEGLPVAVTIALAVGVQRMASRGAIVRRLSAVESLGSTNVICTDKTGTLTRNEMTVTHIHLPSNVSVSVSGAGYEPVGTFSIDGRELDRNTQLDLDAICDAAVLCNDAKLLRNQDGRWEIVGDPTEAALVTLFGKTGRERAELEAKAKRIDEIPFDSDERMMATLHETNKGTVTFIKGAPEKILSFCSHALINGEPIPLDETKRRNILAAENAMASKALRLLALGRISGTNTTLPTSLNALETNFVYLGLVGQIDPPRIEVFDAIEDCKRAGIQVTMVTGDHKVTAKAIGEQLGILGKDDIVVDGSEFARMSEDELTQKFHRIRVFSRVHPSQKLKIVERYQANRSVVAMTGDGVNDAPALANADVGVAMGITGTEVAKQAAKIVITDDNFATIVHAVREGRIIFSNIKKLIVYLLSTGASELIVLILALILGLPLPLAAVQILWINLVTDGAVTVTLIMEPAGGNEMRKPPLPSKQPIVTRSMFKRMLLLSSSIAVSTLGYFVFRLSQGLPFEQVRSGTFTVLAVCQWYNVLNCRSNTTSVFKLGFFSNKWVISALILSNILQFSVIYLPFMNKIFHTTPIPASEVLVIGVVASLVLWVEEVRKFFARKIRSK